MLKFKTMQVPENYDDIAPDGSEVRLLPIMDRGSVCHCTLRAGKTSLALKHKTIEEIWYFLEGQGELWRRQNDHEKTAAEILHQITAALRRGKSWQTRNQVSRVMPNECIYRLDSLQTQ